MPYPEGMRGVYGLLAWFPSLKLGKNFGGRDAVSRQLPAPYHQNVTPMIPAVTCNLSRQPSILAAMYTSALTDVLSSLTFESLTMTRRTCAVSTLFCAPNSPLAGASGKGLKIAGTKSHNIASTGSEALCKVALQTMYLTYSVEFA